MKLAYYGLAICFTAVILSGAWLYGCAPAGSDQAELMVFTAMSLKKPMTEIARSYESQNTGVKVNLNCAGSSSLVAQLTAGAPADVFVSASRWDMDALVQKGLLDVDTRRIFAYNSVVLITPTVAEAKVSGFKDLAVDKVSRIAVGNPKLTPVGVYAKEILEYYDVSNQVKDKLIYCDQVAQICDYTARGEVDAGIVFLTDYLARKDQLVLVAEAPADSHQPVEYPAAVIKQSRHKQEASGFVALICSVQGRGILSANGFRPVNEVDK